MAVILPSVFQDGAATVSNGGTTVTFTGAALTGAVLPGDFFGVHRGYAVRILDVVSSSEVMLANPWPGVSQTDEPYEIMLQNDLARVQETTRRFLEGLQGSAVSALNTAGSGEGRFPYYTAEGVATLGNMIGIGPLFSVAHIPHITGNDDGTTNTVDLNQHPTDRTVAGSLRLSAAGMSYFYNNADVWRVSPTGVLQAGEVPFARVTGSLADANLPTRLRGQSTGVTDLNAITESGFYRASGTATGHPTGSGVVSVIHNYVNATTDVQIASLSTGVSYVRARASSTWGAWVKVLRENDVVGTVSSGAGGAVMERGSNANGEYILFADGTAIAWGSTGTTAATSASGSVFVGDSSWTLPITFTSTRQVTANVKSTARWAAVRGTAGTVTVRQFSTISDATLVAADCIAVGRWY